MLRSSEVDHTGVRQEGFGEGVYLASASSSWGRYSGGRPDRSDRNQVLDNHVHDTAAETIDVKEGTRDVHAAAETEPADCVRGRNPRFCSGFEVHIPIEGSGARNTLRANRLEVNAPGAGIWLQNTAVGRGNVIGCDNEVVGAAAGRTPRTTTPRSAAPPETSRRA